ncbi:MAG: efflux RND transporter periplasmic adaptor subunit [Deltaproteobacteria bacterium]|nr:efflux RND transporter periplasmic adaptor subunit [Deltaproteobacteria bacterium]
MAEQKGGAVLHEQAQGKGGGHQKTASQTEGKKKGKIRYWRSSMDPAEIYDKPGKDKMGMDLVPVYEGAEAAGPPGTVKIDPVTIQNIGVKTTMVRRKRLTREIRTVGRVAYNEEKVRQISPKIGGWVEKQYVNFPGQVVEKGKRLLEIYSPGLVSTQEEYLLALKAKEGLVKSPFPEVASSGNSLAESAERRLKLWDITDEQIKALRDRGLITRTMVLHAPFAGIILKRDVLEGGYVQPGQNLYSIADISTVWVYADVYEYEAPWVRLGQRAEMVLSYQPGSSYHGKVTYVYPYLKNMTRTLQVRMEFPNTRGFTLKPDMWANVTLHAEVARQGLSIPIQAVIRTGKRDIALVALEGGRFAPRDLRIGAQVGDEFEVLDGLKEGERVVTSAQVLIDSESNLQVAVSKMMEAKPQEKGQERPPAPAGEKPGMPGMPGM